MGFLSAENCLQSRTRPRWLSSSSSSLWALAQGLWCTGLGALRRVGSSRTRDGSRVPCVGRRVLNPWATREVWLLFFFVFSITAYPRIFNSVPRATQQDLLLPLPWTFSLYSLHPLTPAPHPAPTVSPPLTSTVCSMSESSCEASIPCSEGECLRNECYWLFCHLWPF